MKGLNSNCTRNVQIVSISYIKKHECLKNKQKKLFVDIMIKMIKLLHKNLFADADRKWCLIQP